MAFSPTGPLLDACVLAMLSRRDMYGYQLTQSIQGAVELSESTLYPVLRRLQKDGLLTTYDQPWQGRNRRYYAITDRGRAKHHIDLMDWREYARKMEELLGVNAS